MARYRKVDPRIWNDRNFSQLSDKGKLVFFFLLTHPHMTSLGAMRATVAGLASELGWNEKAFREAFTEVLSKGMAKHDERACFVWLPKFIKYNAPESPNVVKAWLASWDMLPECDMKVSLYQEVKDYLEGLPEAFGKALSIPFPKSMPNQEQEQEQEQKQDKNNYAGVARDVLAFLNQKANRCYPDNQTNLGFIVARLREGFTDEQCRQVVAKKTREWSGDEKMGIYLRPETLFRKTKFSQYVGELVMPVAAKQ